MENMIKETDKSGPVSFVWDIHYDCDYRCGYCKWFGKWHRLVERDCYHPARELISCWGDILRLYGPVNIEISGGEPFSYPGFLELLPELCKIHSVCVRTNLSFDLKSVTDSVRAENAKIVPTFHPMFAGFSDFVYKAKILVERGYMRNEVLYLAYPGQLRLFDFYKREFLREGLALMIRPFFGDYRGVRYPQGYASKEWELINRDLPKREYIVNAEGSQRFLKGRPCHAGQSCAKINSDGSVFRCEGALPLQKIGNLFGRELRLLTEASPCTSESCNLGEWAANLAEKELVYKEIEAEEKGSAVRSAVSCGYILEEIRPEGAERQDVVVARSRIVPHRIFYTWDIHYACNYRCSYCNTPKPNDSLKSWDRDRMKVVYPTLGRLISVWYDLYERYGSSEIHITGGEPTIYPNFFKLVNNLSRFHTLEVISNLSFDASQLIDAVSAQRLRLGATFHPEFCNIDDFVNKLKILKNSGFEVWTNYVAHPSQLKEMSDHRKKIIDSQATFNIQPYLGFYQGREYPSGYTPEELQLLKDCYDDQDFVNTKTIEWKTAQKKRDMRARSCRMGQMYAKIYPVGDAYRCCAKGSARLGNIFDGTFELQNEAAICESEHCFCWRCMLVDGEKDWGQHWVIPGDKRIVDENDPIPERHILAEQGT